MISRPSPSHVPDQRFWKDLWRTCATPKIVIFLWRVMSNSIPSKSNLFKRKTVTDPRCSICNEEVESVEHIFLLCPWTRRVWFGSRLSYRPCAASISSMDKWWRDCLHGVPMDEDQRQWWATYSAFCLWEIWKVRCHTCMRGCTPSSDEVISSINCMSSEFLAARS